MGRGRLVLPLDATLLIPSQLPKIGHEAIRRFYEYHGGYNKLHHDDVPLLMLDGNRAVTLVEHHGVDKHDREIYLMTAGYFVFDGPKIRQYRVIFDTAQLHGAIPGVL